MYLYSLLRLDVKCLALFHLEALERNFSYAFLDEKAARAFDNLSSEADIWSQKPEGGELYVIDFIAPFGRVMSCCREVHREIFRKFVKHPKYEAKSVVPFEAFRRPSDRRSKWKATPLSCRLQKT